MLQSSTPIVIAEYGGLRCTNERLQEIDDGRVIVTVPMLEVQGIALRQGLLSPHPILQIGFGLILAVVGGFPIVHLIGWMIEGGTILKAEALLVPLALLGLWLIAGAFRRGYYLEVESPRGRQRFCFEKQAERAEVEAFLGAVEKQHGVSIARQA